MHNTIRIECVSFRDLSSLSASYVNDFFKVANTLNVA